MGNYKPYKDRGHTRMVNPDEYQVFDGAAFKKINYLDKWFMDLLGDDYEEYQSPALIAEDILVKCGYFSSFPHQITVAAPITPNFYEEIVEHKAVSREHLSNRRMYLLPAACLHIYPLFWNKIDITTKIITTKAQVFRCEEEFDRSTRLWNFNIREIVFIGERDFVLEKLEEFQRRSLVLAQKVSSDAEMKSAVDNFYPTSKNKVKEKIQKASNLKHELIISVKNVDVAIASFNYHHTHFSQAFNFDRNSRIVTGCVGYGMERWLAACMEHNFSFA